MSGIPANMEQKKTLLIASADEDRQNMFAAYIHGHLAGPTIFMAVDGSEALHKALNAPPHVLIIDRNLPKLSGLQLTEEVLGEKSLQNMAVIIVSPIPDREHFVDEVVLGRVQFLTEESNEIAFNRKLVQALNYAFQNTPTEFHLKFLAAGEILIRQGDRAETVYILRRGQMRAYSETEKAKERVVFGFIEVGEFIGEMAYINGEPRSASVDAVGDCELIEIPMNTFDHLLFQKPSWSKALMATLSRRLKAANIKSKL